MDGIIYIIGFVCTAIFIVGVWKTIDKKKLLNKSTNIVFGLSTLFLIIIGFIFLFWLGTIIDPMKIATVLLVVALLKYIIDDK